MAAFFITFVVTWDSHKVWFTASSPADVFLKLLDALVELQKTNSPMNPIIESQVAGYDTAGMVAVIPREPERWWEWVDAEAAAIWACGLDHYEWRPDGPKWRNPREQGA